MRHPILSKNYLELRRKIAGIVHEKCDVVRGSSIVFVCGSGENSARSRFINLARVEMPDYDFLRPEDAFLDSWGANDGSFNIVDFEKLIADLSHVVVLFPEAAGSFCETGYFVAREEILRKLLLAIDRNYENSESFISMGPLHYVNQHSFFRPAIYTDYHGDFSVVLSRIRRGAKSFNSSQVSERKFGGLTAPMKIGVIQLIIRILRIATIQDIIFMINSIYGQSYPREIKSLLLILMAMGYIKKVSDYGHYHCIDTKPFFLRVRSGYREIESEIYIRVAEVINNSSEFMEIMDGVA